MCTERTRRQRERLNEMHANAKAIQELARDQLNKRLLSLLALYDDTVNELVDLMIEIREVQDYKTGTITLDLVKCSPDGCVGCPHVRWKKWSYKSSKQSGKDGQWIPRLVTNPRAYARAKHIPEEAREAIARAEVVNRQREALMKQLRSIRTTVINLEKNRFDD